MNTEKKLCKVGECGADNKEVLKHQCCAFCAAEAACSAACGRRDCTHVTNNIKECE